MDKNLSMCNAWRSGKPEQMLFVKQYIDNHYMHKLTIDDLADHFFISKYHLMREFKKYTGQTIHAYLNQVRIHQAQRVLISLDISKAYIAMTTGFEDYSLFYRSFIKHTGCSPAQFCKRSTGEDV